MVTCGERGRPFSSFRSVKEEACRVGTSAAAGAFRATAVRAS